mgnify:CR=1 FL=1
MHVELYISIILMEMLVTNGDKSLQNFRGVSLH